MTTNELMQTYRDPENHGELAECAIRNETESVSCGDRIRFDIDVDDGTVETARFSGEGCVISIATASYLATAIEGETLEDAAAFDDDAVIDLLPTEISPLREKCAFLPRDVVREGIETYLDAE